MNGATSIFDALTGGRYSVDNRASSGQGTKKKEKNFFEKFGESLANTFGTTGAAIAGGINENIENQNIEERRKNIFKSRNDVAKRYGYDSYDAVWDARDAAEASGDTAKVKEIDDGVVAALKEDANQTSKNIRKAGEDYRNYRENSYIGQKTNQDPGKFAGSAIRTLSLPAGFVAGTNPIGQAAIGAAEGLADELEENGLENFNGQQALQNMALGAAAGGTIGKLNKGLDAKTLANGGQLIKGSNILARGASKIANTGIGRGAISGAAGGAIGGGLSSAMNGEDIGTGLQNTLQGAISGLGEGALVGGAFGAGGKIANKLSPKTAQAANDFAGASNKWRESGDNFNERLTNTLTSGESPVGEWLQGNRQSKLLGSAGNRIAEDINNTNLGMRVKGVSGEQAPNQFDNMDINELSDYRKQAYENYKNADTPEAKEQYKRDLFAAQDEQSKRLNAVGAEGVRQQLQNADQLPQDIQNMRVNNGEANALANNEPTDLTSVFEPNANNAIQRRNKLQSIGQQLQNSAKTQKYGALYDALDKKTAARAVQTGAPDQLAELGVRPENYLEAAKTSNYINKVVSDLAEKSGIKTNVPDLPARLSLDNIDVVMSEPAAKKYNSYIKQIVADGNTPDEYSAGYLLQKSREFGNKAANLRGNTDDVNTLRAALTDAKYTLRDAATKALEEAGITGDLTNDNIANGLAKIGANEKIQDYYTAAVDGKAPSVADYIRRSSLFEQARDMGAEIEAEKYTRSASKAPTNPFTRLWVASGLDQPLNTVLRNTTAPIAGGITSVAGKAIERAGNVGAKIANSEAATGAANTGRNIASAVGSEVNTNPASTALWNTIGRIEGERQGNRANNGEFQAAEQPATNNATALYDSLYGATAAQTGDIAIPDTANASGIDTSGSYFGTTGDYWTDLLGVAMTNAINDGDMASVSDLYSMYKDAISLASKKNTGNNANDPSTWSSGDRSKLVDAQNALGQIDTLESAYNSATGGAGGNVLQGNLRSLAANISGGNLDPSASNYNNLAQSVGMGIVKNMINLGVTEADAQRYLQYLPALTDTKEQASQKLATLRQIYQNQINNLYSNYEQTPAQQSYGLQDTFSY